MIDYRVAFHHHQLRVQVANVHQYRHSVPVVLGEIKHRLSRGSGEETAHGDSHLRQAIVNLIQEELVGHHKAHQRAELTALQPHRLQRALAIVHPEPRRGTVHHDARELAQILRRFFEHRLNVPRGYSGIGAFEINAGFRCVHLCECAGHPHVDLADTVVALRLRFGHRRAIALSSSPGLFHPSSK